VVKYLFSSNKRIRQKSEFEQAFLHKRLTNKWFVIYLFNRNNTFARLGMVVSKKTIAKSVYRNYAKRLIREVFRLNAERLPTLDFVIRIRRNLTKDTSADARNALLQLILSANIS